MFFTWLSNQDKESQKSSEEGGAVSAWMAGSGSRDFSLSGGVEGVGEMVVMLGDGEGLRFQMAILVEGCWEKEVGWYFGYARSGACQRMEISPGYVWFDAFDRSDQDGGEDEEKR
jgi:hypothetical protein